MSLFLLFHLLIRFGHSDLTTSIAINFEDSSYLEPVPSIYWQSCGFTPATDMLNPNGTENMWWIGIIPRNGIHYIRVHYLLDLLKVKGINANESLEYEWNDLDAAMDILRKNNRYPIFELMGNPSMYFNDFTNSTQLYLWKDLVVQTARRYINKYGLDTVSKWVWETWNEPPSWDEGFTFNKTSWSNYYDACNNGLLSVNKDFIFGAPGCHGGNPDYFYYTLEHTTTGTDYFTKQVGNLRIDFISKHNKGNQDEDTLLSEDISTMNIINKNYSSLVNRSVFYNDEGDPKVGWGNPYIWRATPSYAAFVIQGINYHLENFNTVSFRNKYKNKIPFGLISNDNCFMGDGSFQLRTVNARFNDTKTGAFEFIPKSGLQVMSLLSLHGNTRMNSSGIHVNNDGNASNITQILTFVNKSEELYEILVIVYSSDKNQNDKNIKNKININIDIKNFENIVYYDSIIAEWNLDIKHGNPYNTWQSFNSPLLPTIEQIEEMRISSNPSLRINNNGGLNNDGILNAPGVIMTHFVYALGNGKKWNNPPPKVENVKIFQKNLSYSFTSNHSYYISWDSLDSHIISTFIINYSKQQNGSHSIVILTNNILDGYVWITSITSGYIQVSAMDYFGLNGTLSDPVKLPTQ